METSQTRGKPDLKVVFPEDQFKIVQDLLDRQAQALEEIDQLDAKVVGMIEQIAAHRQSEIQTGPPVFDDQAKSA